VDDHYEYMCVYVDDLVICSKDPQGIIDKLTGHHKFNLKGTGPIHFHLGSCDYFRDHDDIVLCYGPRRCIDKMVQDFDRMVGHNPDHVHPHSKKVVIIQKQTTVSSLSWMVSNNANLSLGHCKNG
jgi:hypothetical protein